MRLCSGSLFLSFFSGSIKPCCCCCRCSMAIVHQLSMCCPHKYVYFFSFSHSRSCSLAIGFRSERFFSLFNPGWELTRIGKKTVNGNLEKTIIMYETSEKKTTKEVPDFVFFVFHIRLLQVEQVRSYILVSILVPYLFLLLLVLIILFFFESFFPSFSQFKSFEIWMLNQM